MNLILASTASLLHCCSAQAFLPPNDALRTRSTQEECLAMSIFLKVWSVRSIYFIGWITLQYYVLITTAVIAVAEQKSG